MQRRSDLFADPRFASYLGRLYGTESDASVLGLRSDVDLGVGRRANDAVCVLLGGEPVTVTVTGT